ncbi:serine hydrolase domain-containing protein [Bradyrhizobium erythrophlei]|uniref:CubicO group peptidase, beta-lactamase class C family n=1 Tax=Bradyrhizobium erythrophlei TaxID=1437360 RepID=A0A1M7U868_9BRAD|nr:serine hydrolase domain-containing protein [Bradyrhizobium erythrophlei]SHN79077.1 CubicO group peptidase, beta-lactamase class C family [Bradyrhizobium erythrophlei]
MAWIWNRILPKARHAGTAPSAQIDGYIAGLIRPDRPGLALTVLKGGVVVHAAGYGLANMDGRAITPDTIFHLASCGKQFTGLGISMLADEGKLDVDDSLGKYLPTLSGFGPEMTIRRLLHHTSGIRDLYDEEGFEKVLARFERATNADMIRTYADLGCPMATDGCRPGDEFFYSNSGYELLGAVIETVSGQSYHDFFQQRVFDVVGMKDTFSIPDQRTGDPRCATGYFRDDRGGYVVHGGFGHDEIVGSGSFYTTVSDLGLYDRALATNSLLSEAGMREIFTSGRTNDGSATNYGFGWYVGVNHLGRFAEHEGSWSGFYSYICRYLDQPLSIFVLSNHPDLDLFEIASETTAAFD